MWFDAAATREHALWTGRHRSRAHALTEQLPPSFARHVMTGWDERYGIPQEDSNRSPVALANTFARDTVKAFKAANCGDAYDEQAIMAHATNFAMVFACMESLRDCRTFGARMGVQPPTARAMTPETERARWQCPQWWRRQLRKVWKENSESAMRASGIVRRGRQPYASDEAVRSRIASVTRQREWMESRAMVNESGEQLELIELHKHSLANPALRRGEFMLRVRGFEELADSLGHVALFFTMTTPSRFHAQLSAGGVNPAWEAKRARVRDGQRWLCDTWAAARAKLARLSVLYYGVRVAEPHHDGTPHWHAIIFVPSHQSDALQRVLRDHWLADAGKEKGAAERRITCKPIDREKGSAVGYVAKYIAKNIDAFGGIGDAESDETGAPVSEGVQRVAAWASVHRIRQFQQMGGPPVGMWREARRLREAVPQALIESVREPASRKGASWSEFIGALGGIERARRRVGSVRTKNARTVRVPRVRVYRAAKKQGRGLRVYRPLKRQPAPELFTAVTRARRPWTRLAWDWRDARPDEMPAVWLDREAPRATDPAGRDVLAFTRYGEQSAPRAAGLCAFGLLGRFQSADTRPHRWRIERKASNTPRGGVMNPPAPAALGAEARNPTNAPIRRPCHGMVPPGSAQATRDLGEVLSDSAPRSGAPALGPVAITVRDAAGQPAGDPSAWTARETSMAGPGRLQ